MWQRTQLQPYREQPQQPMPPYREFRAQQELEPYREHYAVAAAPAPAQQYYRTQPSAVAVPAVHARPLYREAQTQELQPYQQQQTARPSSQPAMAQARDPFHEESMLMPFGGGDPFGSMLDDMMMSPFGDPFGGRGRMGGGGIFGMMDQMMGEMHGMSMGMGGSMAGLERSGGCSMMMQGMSAGGGGGYSCQTMMVSSGMGNDGKMRTEKFSSSSVGDYNGQMHEVQQAYSNSHTGVDKMSLERQLQGRGRKTVKERSSVSGEERSTDMYKGMAEEDYPEFDRQWQEVAVPRLPQHAAGGVRQLMAGSGARPQMTTQGTHYGGVPARPSSASQHQYALPAPPYSSTASGYATRYR